MKNTFRNLFVVALSLLTLISCRKDQSANLGIAITGGQMSNVKTSVNIQEVWLNYSTKKSKSEWLKLNITPGNYDLSALYFSDSVTTLLQTETIEELKTFLQMRITFGADSNEVITNFADTLPLTMSAGAIQGEKLLINQNTFDSRKNLITVEIGADSLSLESGSPVFIPSLRLKSMTEE